MRALTTAACTAVVLCAATFLPGVAHADPVESLVEVVHHPTDPDTVLGHYRNGGEGLWLTHDGGMTFELIANSFIDPTGRTRDDVIGISDDGSLWLSASTGTFRSDPDGCSFALDEQIGEHWVWEFVTDPTDPHVLYAITGDTEAGTKNGLLVRDADGKWSELGTRDELLLYSLRVVSTDAGLRFVVTARKDEPVQATDGGPTFETTFMLRVSEDLGESWEDFPFDPGLEAPEIVAIDPEDRDRLLLWMRGDIGDDTLLVSLDGGRTVEPWLDVADWSGVAILPGGRVLIGDRGLMSAAEPGGLWSATSLASAPEPFAGWSVRCLDYDVPNDTLFGCELRGYGTIDRDDGKFTVGSRWLETQLLECPGIDVARASQVQLCSGFCLNHFPESPACAAYQLPTCGPCSTSPPSPGCTLYPEPADAGAPVLTSDAGDAANGGGGRDDAGTHSSAGGGGCGCSTLGRAHAADTLALAASAFALALTATRRLRRRKPR